LSSCFSYASKLHKLSFESGTLLYEIGGLIFRPCRSVKAIGIPANVPEIDGYAFRDTMIRSTQVATDPCRFNCDDRPLIASSCAPTFGNFFFESGPSLTDGEAFVFDGGSDLFLIDLPSSHMIVHGSAYIGVKPAAIFVGPGNRHLRTSAHSRR
jgi:hypothetical protein